MLWYKSASVSAVMKISLTPPPTVAVTDAGRLVDLINQFRVDIHHCLTGPSRVSRRIRRALAVNARIAVTDFNVAEQPYRFLCRAGRLGNLERRPELERFTAGIEPLAVDTFSVTVLILISSRRSHRHQALSPGVGLRCLGLRINPEIFPDSYALLIVDPSVDTVTAAVCPNRTVTTKPPALAPSNPVTSLLVWLPVIYALARNSVPTSCPLLSNI